jgi:hypothetical protein
MDMEEIEAGGALGGHEWRGKWIEFQSWRLRRGQGLLEWPTLRTFEPVALTIFVALEIQSKPISGRLI